MTVKQNAALLIVPVLMAAGVLSQSAGFPELKGPYLGQKPPGMVPEVFAPGIVSRGYDERMAFFTPDGRELYYQLRGAPHTIVVHMKEENGTWGEAETAFFSGRYFSEFSLSPDGSKIVYCSNQPADNLGPPSDQWRTWMVEKTESGWSEPADLGIKTAYPTLSAKGNIYFFDYRKDGSHDGQIFVSKCTNGKYSAPEDISDEKNDINSDSHEVDPFIAPDESYLIFTSNRPGGFGEADLYICFRKKDGAWTRAMNMGPAINTEAVEFCPSVTPDGKYLFFSSGRSLFSGYSTHPITYSEKVKILDSPGNGSNDIYWVSAKILEELRPGNSPAWIRR